MLPINNFLILNYMMHKNMETQRDGKTERQKDRKTEKQKDRKTERQ